MYGAETWRITENNRRKLKIVETDVFRGYLGISHKDRIHNKKIKQQMCIRRITINKLSRNNYYCMDIFREWQIQGCLKKQWNGCCQKKRETQNELERRNHRSCE